MSSPSKEVCSSCNSWDLAEVVRSRSNRPSRTFLFTLGRSCQAPGGVSASISQDLVRGPFQAPASRPEDPPEGSPGRSDPETSGPLVPASPSHRGLP